MIEYITILGRLEGIFSFLGWFWSAAVSYVLETIFLLIFVMISLIAVIYLFRKYMARVQLRIGPNRVGKFGILQLVADVLKLAGKEIILPKNRDRLPYSIAPMIVIFGMMLAFAFLPYGSLIWFGDLTITHSTVDLIFIFAIIAIMPIGELLAGISSRNKYSLMGSLRSVAKDISFEIPMMLAVLAIVIMSSARPVAGGDPSSLIHQSVVTTEILPYGILQPIGLFVFFIAMVARSSFSPFDMAESESELVSGYSTEYAGLRYGLFYAGLFGTIFFASLLTSLLYLGGFNGPLSQDLGFVWLLIKGVILTIIFFTVWLAMPRIRIDRLVNSGWKYLLPIAFINLILAGALTLGLGW